MRPQKASLLNLKTMKNKMLAVSAILLVGMLSGGVAFAQTNASTSVMGEGHANTATIHGNFWTGLLGNISNGIRLFFGTISNINVAANTFTLTNRNGNTAQVNVDASTTIRIGGNGTSTATTTIAGLSNGMFAAVVGHATGTASSSVITATKVKAAIDPLDVFNFWGIRLHGGFHLGFGKHMDTDKDGK